MKIILKTLFKILIKCISFPIAILFVILAKIADKIERFSEIALIVAYIPLYVGEEIRNVFYKMMLNSLGENTVFKFGSYCQYTDIEIGSNCTFGYFNTIGSVKIGDNVLCGANVIFQSGRHQHSFDEKDKLINSQLGVRETIKIGSDIWIGNNCIVAASVGNRAVLGTSTLVIKSLEGNGVYIKQPAVLLKKI